MKTQFAAYAFLWATALSCAADPFPNQPGALSEQDIQAAQDAMTQMLGSEPRLPLAASGRRVPGHVMPSYVIFAAPPARKSARVLAQRRVICNFFGPAGQWRCSTPHDALHVDANGVKHVLLPQAQEGSMDVAEAVEIADYLYSACFAAQFKRLDEARDVTSFNALPIHTIMKRPGPAYSVFTGMWPDEDIYSLIGSVKPADGCRYKVVSVTFGKREWERQEAKRKQEEAERIAQEEAARIAQPPREVQTPIQVPPVKGSNWVLGQLLDPLMDAAVGASVLCGLLALVAPFFWLRKGRKAATGVALTLAGASVALGVVYFIMLKVASITDTGFGLLLVIPAVMLAALACMGWVIALAMQRDRPTA